MSSSADYAHFVSAFRTPGVGDGRGRSLTSRGTWTIDRDDGLRGRGGDHRMGRIPPPRRDPEQIVEMLQLEEIGIEGVIVSWLDYNVEIEWRGSAADGAGGATEAAAPADRVRRRRAPARCSVRSAGAGWSSE